METGACDYRAGAHILQAMVLLVLDSEPQPWQVTRQVGRMKGVKGKDIPAQVVFFLLKEVGQKTISLIKEGGVEERN